MRRSANRRAATQPRTRRRLLAAAGALVVFGGIIGVTQISNADDNAAAQTKKTSQSGLEILADDCSESALEAHDGFQKGGRCVSTEFGEVGTQEKNPTLLITDAPKSVEAGKPFQLKVSTRNLVRDRFLAAGQGGYYVESSVLTAEGLVRGHFHTACRMLSSTSEAPDPAPVPAFFVATEDKKGSGTPDTVTIQVPGMPDEGVAQCASWAGDGSHRIPMMQRANQIPSLDAVRIKVRKGAEQPPAEEPPAEQPPAEQPPAEEPPAEQPPAQEPPAEQPPAQEQPPAEEEEQEPAPAPPAKPQTNSGTVKSTTPPESEDDKQESTKAPTKAATRAATKAPAEDDSAEEQPAQSLKSTGSAKKTAEPKSTESDDLVITTNEDDGAPDPDAPGSGIEPAAAQSQDKLAFTGTSTAAVIGGGTVVLLIGFVILSATRRRRPRTHWHQ